jgi:hypothetical protein
MEEPMKRTSEMGLFVFGIVLIVVGAIMRYAVEVRPDGFDVHTAGIIILLVGLVAGLVGLALVFMGRTSHTSVTERMVTTPTGQVRTVDRSDSLLPCGVVVAGGCRLTARSRVRIRHETFLRPLLRRPYEPGTQAPLHCREEPR